MVSFSRKAIGEVVNPEGNGAMNLLCLVGDINNDGFNDVVIAPRNGKLVWFENNGTKEGWEKHLIDEIENLEAGGVLYDLTGNGYLDLIIGGDYKSDELSWWENPGPGQGRWKKRLIYKTGATQFHDQIIGDITGDGKNSLVFWNQNGKTLYRVPLPEDPGVSPWPDVEEIATGYSEEGLAIADIDNDGQNELISGMRWYKYQKDGKWEINKFADDYVSTRVAVGDLNSDGQKEIVLAEGDAHLFDKPEGGKLAWFSPGENIREMWEEHILGEKMLDPHSMQLGNLSGNGNLDLFVGEMGIPDDSRIPRIMVFENDGDANFTRHIIDDEVSTHEAKLGDMQNKGVLDIVGKPLFEPEQWKVHIWFNNQGK